MKYIQFTFEHDLFYLELKEDQTASRQIIISELETHLSSREDCLAEGEVDEIEAEVMEIDEATFNQVWQEKMQAEQEAFQKLKAHYTIGKPISGKILFIRSDEIVFAFNEGIGVASYKECRRNSGTGSIYVGKLISGSVKGYDETNAWVVTAEAKLVIEDIKALKLYAKLLENKEVAEGIFKYYDLREKGLKKQANQIIKETMLKFDQLPELEKQQIVIGFCQYSYDLIHLNECHTFWMHEDLPFEVFKRFKTCLKAFVEKREMPHLRWFYELFEKDMECLEQAYQHPNCDTKTIRMYLDALLERLYFGAHHFPEGCCISQEEYEAVSLIVEQIVATHGAELKTGMQEEVAYWKSLYKAWWQYVAAGRQVDFGLLCQENGVVCHSPKSFNYKK